MDPDGRAAVELTQPGQPRRQVFTRSERRQGADAAADGDDRCRPPSPSNPGRRTVTRMASLSPRRVGCSVVTTARRSPAEAHPADGLANRLPPTAATNPSARHGIGGVRDWSPAKCRGGLLAEPDRGDGQPCQLRRQRLAPRHDVGDQQYQRDEHPHSTVACEGDRMTARPRAGQAEEPSGDEHRSVTRTEPMALLEHGRDRPHLPVRLRPEVKACAPVLIARAPSSSGLQKFRLKKRMIQADGRLFADGETLEGVIGSCHRNDRFFLILQESRNFKKNITACFSLNCQRICPILYNSV